MAANFPDQPQVPTLVSQSPTVLRFKWIAPYNGGMPITNYYIYWDGAQPGSGTFLLLKNVTSSILTHNETNIVAGLTYQFKVTATNVIGDSLKSFALTIKAAQQPDQPQQPTMIY